MFSLKDQILECVPNFSEGRNPAIIKAIADSIRQVSGVKLLHVDSGYDANRTVYTFAGYPDAVTEAAFQSIKTAAELIDMRTHQGEHPRMGACDVCPLIPVQNMSMDDAVSLSKVLGQRIGEIGIPVYLYEHSATSPERKHLSYLRKGEYEMIPKKIHLEDWAPDFGPQAFHAAFGMMALGARNFLIAYNVNLDSKDVNLAKAIARQIREYRERHDGSPRSLLFRHVKAIGWYMKSFECAQVSCNITDIEASPVLHVFREIRSIAQELGAETNGSELVGLIPLRAFGMATYDAQVMKKQIDLLGLDSIKQFDPAEHILEYALALDK